MIKVLFLPDWSVRNPYQHLLKEALKANDVEVVMDFFPKGKFGLYKAAQRHKGCDIIHVHWIKYYIEWLFWSKSRIKKALKYFVYLLDILLVKLSGKRIVWTIHNKYMHDAEDIESERKLRKILANNADRVLVHSKSVIPELNGAYVRKTAKNISVVPHGNVIKTYPNTVSRTEARKRLNIKNEKKTFLYFGEIKPYKRVFYLIDIFKTKRALQDCSLLIAGRPESPEIEKEVQELAGNTKNIKTFLSFVPDEDIQLYMNAADAVVFPYENILTSGSAILAMSFGKPIIAPKKGCLIDLLDERGALFFSEDNPLDKVLEKAVNLDLASMGEHNMDAIKKYEWDSIGKQLKGVYSKCLLGAKNE